MGYEGYLIKVASTEVSDNWFIIPHNLIVEKSYKATYSTMDVDSTRVATAVLERTVVDHKVPHCQLEIKPITDKRLEELFGPNGGISTRYEIVKEKSIYVKMWIPELCDYVTAKCYVPDIDFTIKKVDNRPPYSVSYESFTLEFIGY